MSQRDVRHLPVLLDEVLAALDLRPGQVVVDCTVGLGGHAVELFRRVTPRGRLVGSDLDPANLDRARTLLEGVGGTFSLHHGNFAGLPAVLAALGIERVNGLLADVGVASPQIDDPARGFSFKRPGPLDMRMDPTRGRPASELIRTIGRDELATALRDLGDEEDAEAIADLVVERRRERPILTTDDLNAIVCEARGFTLKRAMGAKLHPATRTFQALRMLVNRELPNLQRLLAILPDILVPGGTAAIISFHSGEDRLVKRAFREGLAAGHFAEVAADPVTASEAEVQRNPRARSAKLRWARRA